MLSLTGYLRLYSSNPVKVVVIDAGHGGNDPGAVGITGVKEKDVTLALALKVGELIEKNTNIKVVYTRKKDVFVELYKRAQMANNNHADWFISIHCNSVVNNSGVSGTETFVMGLNKTAENLAIAQKENAAILNEEGHQSNYQGFDPTSAEAYIIFSLYQNAYLDQSINLAAAIQSEFKGVKRQDRGVKQASFLVLYKSAMPSILIETGFLSNKQEEAYLASEKGQTELSVSIFNGFAKAARLEQLDMPDLSKLADTIPADVRTPSVMYAVQFSTSSREYKKTDPELKNLPDIEILRVGDKYKYTTGKFLSHKDASDLLVKVKQSGFPDAFITTWKKDDGVVKKEETTIIPKKTEPTVKPAEEVKLAEVKETTDKPAEVKEVRESTVKPTVKPAEVRESSVKPTVKPAEVKETTAKPAEVKPVEVKETPAQQIVYLKDTPTETNNTIIYKVQIMASGKKLEKTDVKFKNVPDLNIEKVDNLYKYTSGNCTTFSEAQKLQSSLQQAGFSGAFIVPYKNGIRTTIQEAKKINNER